MPKFIEKAAGIFAYKEPPKRKPFEFLENEGERSKSTKSSDDNTAQNQPEKAQGSEEKNTQKKPSKSQKILVSTDLETNMKNIEKELNMSQNKDVIIRRFNIARRIPAFIVYIDGMVDRTIINDSVLKQLMSAWSFEALGDTPVLEYAEYNVLTINQMTNEQNLSDSLAEVLGGMTALFAEGCDHCLLLETKGYEKRAVGKPATENVIRGSQEGFTEDLRTNLTQVRRIIKNRNLVTETMRVGKTAHTDCAIMYLEGVANPRLIAEVKRRISSIDTDLIVGDGLLEQLVENRPFNIFPQLIATERPDRAAAFISAGKVVIFTNGAPFIEAVPMTFFHLLYTSEDYSLRWQYGTFIRFIRLVGMLFALLLPSLYVALTLYRQEMIPTELLISIAQAREGVPFPSVFEILMMEISFELIREAGVRVPGVIGQTLGIIGALILGQAAVAAKLVSPILIIIVAVTGLGSFSIPNYSLGLAIRILRFFFIFMAAISGFFGIAVGLFITGCIACSVKSFGVPVFSPIAPKSKSNLDIVVRGPLWTMEQKPDILNAQNNSENIKDPRGWAREGKGGDSND